MVQSSYFRNCGIQIPTIIGAFQRKLSYLPVLLGICLFIAIQPGLAQTDNGGCETAWAWNESSLCFNELGEVCQRINKWGFTTISDPIGEPGSDMFDVIESAPGLCNPHGSTGEDVGDIQIFWNTNPPTIQIDLEDHVIQEVHVWIGCTPLPEKGSKCTAAPGQLGCTYELDEPVASFTIDDCLGECLEGTTWIAIHLVTCDDENENGEESLVRIENNSMDTREEKSTESFEISAYPNPANESINVDIGGPAIDDVEITVLNQFGKVVKSMTTNTVSGEQLSIEITEDLPDGIYFISVDNQVNVKLTRVVVQRQK